MSLEAFLAEVAKPESGGGGAFITIAKARVFTCWQGWTDNKSKLFEFEPDNDEAKEAAKIECQAYIDSGFNEREQWPQVGICTHIFGNDVPTNADGNFYWGDIEEFVKKYERDLTVFPVGYPEVPSPFKENELKLVNGPMPYNAVVEGIANNAIVTDWAMHWVKMSQEINQWDKAKGKKNKKGYDNRVHVIQHVYANEAEAKADAETIRAGQNNVQSQVANEQLSAKALESGWTLENLKAKKDDIDNAIVNAVNGLGSAKMSKAKAQSYAAEGYAIEESDLSLIGIEIVPF